jgi:hypothetical protein
MRIVEDMITPADDRKAISREKDTKMKCNGITGSYQLEGDQDYDESGINSEMDGSAHRPSEWADLLNAPSVWWGWISGRVDLLERD